MDKTTVITNKKYGLVFHLLMDTVLIKFIVTYYLFNLSYKMYILTRFALFFMDVRSLFSFVK